MRFITVYQNIETDPFLQDGPSTALSLMLHQTCDMSVSYPLKKANIHMPKQPYKRGNHSNIMSLEQIFPESIKSSLNKVLFKKTFPIQD